jgi:alpha-tubulin suppressor-like RCC1 family protein
MRHRTSVVAFSLLCLQFLAGSASADVLRGSDPGRRPSGPRLASGAAHCSVAGDGAVLCWGNSPSITLGANTVPFGEPVPIAGVASAVSVGVGDSHACALRSDGKVVCWGFNHRLQLGRETAGSDPLPPGEVANLSNVVYLAVGGLHSCAVTVESRVLCWGSNTADQLGPGATTTTATATEVPDVSARTVTAGNAHSCALLTNGAVLCWGDNRAGQISPTANDLTFVTPLDMGLDNTAAISAGHEHTCALLASGAVACWGRNTSRQVTGSTSSTRSAAWVNVTNAGAIAAIGAGTCALIADGTVKCWGNGATVSTHPDVSGAVELDANCALTASGTTRCFFYGSGNPAPTVSRADPQATRARSIGLGANHSCARRLNGNLACWGENSLGQLGDGTLVDRASPVAVRNSTSPAIGASIAAGAAHGCMRTSNGRVQCWGDNALGQTGDPIDGGVRDLFTVIDSGTTPLGNVVAVTNGTNHSCALLAGGQAKCWGSNADGQFGDGTRTNPASPANSVFVKATSSTNLNNILAIAAGGRHTCALLADGTARCWGANDTGQATGQSGNDVLTLATVDSGVAIAAGEHHTCVTRAYGNVRCWGLNTSGQLGPSIGGNIHEAVAVAAVGVAVGDQHTCAVKANGTLACWGENAAGQLGDQSVTDSTTPVLVKQVLTIPCMGGTCDITRVLDKLIAIDAGAGHTCAIRADGQPYCWGADGSGQLGDGAPLSNKSTARPVSNFSGS